MKVTIEEGKIVLSQVPAQHVAGALLIVSAKLEGYKYTDVEKGVQEYDLPDGIEEKDIEALYLRII